jgi:hypothetical protein
MEAIIICVLKDDVLQIFLRLTKVAPLCRSFVEEPPIVLAAQFARIDLCLAPVDPTEVHEELLMKSQLAFFTLTLQSFTIRWG